MAVTAPLSSLTLATLAVQQQTGLILLPKCKFRPLLAKNASKQQQH